MTPLLIIPTDGRPRALAVDRPTHLGRRSDCTLRLGSHNISRHHARIIWDGARAWIEDLDSHNGTFVNGQRISVPTALNDLDELRLADVALRFRVVEHIPRGVDPQHGTGAERGLVVFRCPHCTHRIGADPAMAHFVRTCPTCRQRLIVSPPSGDTAVVADAEAQADVTAQAAGEVVAKTLGKVDVKFNVKTAADAPAQASADVAAAEGVAAHPAESPHGHVAPAAHAQQHTAAEGAAAHAAESPHGHVAPAPHAQQHCAAEDAAAHPAEAPHGHVALAPHAQQHTSAEGAAAHPAESPHEHVAPVPHARQHIAAEAAAAHAAEAPHGHVAPVPHVQQHAAAEAGHVEPGFEATGIVAEAPDWTQREAPAAAAPAVSAPVVKLGSAPSPPPPNLTHAPPSPEPDSASLVQTVNLGDAHTTAGTAEPARDEALISELPHHAGALAQPDATGQRIDIDRTDAPPEPHATEPTRRTAWERPATSIDQPTPMLVALSVIPAREPAESPSVEARERPGIRMDHHPSAAPFRAETHPGPVVGVAEIPRVDQRDWFATPINQPWRPANNGGKGGSAPRSR